MFFPVWAESQLSVSEKRDKLCERVIDGNLRDVVNRARCSDEEKEKLQHALSHYLERMKNEPFPESTKDILTHFIRHFWSAFYPERQTPKCWIEKTTSTEIYAQEIKTWFPKAKFIHIIRDPRDNWASMKSGWEKRYQHFNTSPHELMHSLLERGKLGMEFAERNRNSLGEEAYHVVRYEDLTENLEEEMKKISTFIGINYSETMLSPSTFNHEWHGNNFNNIKSNKAFTTNVNRWPERITPEEAQLVEYYFSNVMQGWGYEPVFSAKEQQVAAMNHYKWSNFSS
jgi:hypothetical protein